MVTQNYSPVCVFCLHTRTAKYARKKQNPMKIRIAFTWLAVLSSFAPVLAQKTWELKKKEDGIEVFVRDNPHSPIKELLIETRIEASLSSVAALLNDADHYHRWVYRTSHSELVRRLSPHQLIYHTILDFPWPLSDRELYVFSEMRQDPQTHTLYSISRLWSEAPPPTGKYVRIPYFHSEWSFTPQADGTLRVRYFLRSDPGGYLPAWLVNLVIDQGPVATIEAFRQMVHQPPYRHAQLAHIVEPQPR